MDCLDISKLKLRLVFWLFIRCCSYMFHFVAINYIKCNLVVVFYIITIFVLVVSWSCGKFFGCCVFGKLFVVTSVGWFFVVFSNVNSAYITLAAACCSGILHCKKQFFEFTTLCSSLLGKGIIITLHYITIFVIVIHLYCCIWLHSCFFVLFFGIISDGFLKF